MNKILLMFFYTVFISSNSFGQRTTEVYTNKIQITIRDIRYSGIERNEKYRMESKLYEELEKTGKVRRILDTELPIKIISGEISNRYNYFDKIIFSITIDTLSNRVISDTFGVFIGTTDDFINSDIITRAAISLVKNIIILQPGFDLYFKEGIKYYNSKEYILARQNFENALAFDSTKIDLLYYLGKVCFYLEDFELALKYLIKTKNENYEKIEMMIYIADIYRKRNDYNKAIEEYLAILNMSPDNKEALNGVCKAYYWTNNWLAARQHCGLCLSLDPHNDTLKSMINFINEQIPDTTEPPSVSVSEPIQQREKSGSISSLPIIESVKNPLVDSLLLYKQKVKNQDSTMTILDSETKELREKNKSWTTYLVLGIIGILILFSISLFVYKRACQINVGRVCHFSDLKELLILAFTNRNLPKPNFATQSHSFIYSASIFFCHGLELINLFLLIFQLKDSKDPMVIKEHGCYEKGNARFIITFGNSNHIDNLEVMYKKFENEILRYYEHYEIRCNYRENENDILIIIPTSSKIKININLFKTFFKLWK